MPDPMPYPVSAPHIATILVVEDNINQRFTVAEWLRAKNYLVLEAATASDAELLLASPQRIDVVLTDVWMPGMTDGLDLINYIRRVFPRIHVIAISGIYDRSRVDNSIPFVKKPFDLEEISSLVAQLLGGEQHA